jgi:two-component system cell cycle response regulator
MVAERIRERIATEPIKLADGGPTALTVTVSIGVATSGGGDTTPDDILRRADAAMYRAKAAGRNRVETDQASGAVDATPARTAVAH